MELSYQCSSILLLHTCSTRLQVALLDGGAEVMDTRWEMMPDPSDFKRINLRMATGLLIVYM